MNVETLRRYPVKSMLGEMITEAVVDDRGFESDRRLALIDVETGRVATAKHPRLWRGLLKFSATATPDGVSITLPDGRVVAAGEAAIDALLSELLGRRVRLVVERTPGAEVERPAPEDVLEHGVDADVPFALLEIAQATPGTTFVDYAPVHLITTATLERIGVEAVRYRPNVVIQASTVEAFAENDWVGREIVIGDVRLRGILPTPRCSVPTLEHGDLPREPRAVRPLLTDNRIDVPGFGVLPCAGLYAEVLTPGTVRVGDPVTVL